MNKQSAEILDFIEQNIKLNISEIALQLSKKSEWPKAFILNQINGRQKALKKFPFLTRFPNFEFSNPTAVAQASSEESARFKASLIKGSSIADLSGGMGIDAYFFSHNFKQVAYIEKNTELFNLTKKNLSLLAKNPIECFNDSAENWLEQQVHFDWIYLDPDRRVEKSKTFQIETCSPNVIELLPQLFNKTEQLLLKLSPLLDIKEGIRKLPGTKAVYVIAVDGECKELLFLLEKNHSEAPEIKAVNLIKNQAIYFNFNFEEEASLAVNYTKPLTYLYEPNAAILKSGAFKSIAARFQVHKLSENTHLYTSNNFIKTFPGRVIAIEKVGKPEKKFIPFANVVSRNFPLSSFEIRKKYGIKEGQKEFLYACTLVDKQKIFIAGKLL